MAAFLVAAFVCAPLCAQNTAQAVSPETTTEQGDSAADAQRASTNTTREKWWHFVHETVSPLTFTGGTFNAAFSQVTDTDPKYGVNNVALANRFGASMADIASQNFFGDFVAASALHENPCYYRMGQGHGFWPRVGYAISRAAVIRKDSGGNSFNFDNAIGSALSTAVSNLYYPPASRTGKGMLMHFGIDMADTGFVNLVPEFWPDFRQKILRRHHSH
jgi:hypothetical protein